MEAIKLQMNEVKRETGLTKKAINYYCQQDLISPNILDNGYKDFNKIDVEQLKKIAILRKCEVSIADIRFILKDRSGESLSRVAAKNQFSLPKKELEKQLLNSLASGMDYNDIIEEIKVLDSKQTIIEKILIAFPGYYGRFICYHFSRFLNEPITSDRQKSAYESIVSFLDSVTLNVPIELQEYINQLTTNLSNEAIEQIVNQTEIAVNNTDEFIQDNQQLIEDYLAFKQTEEYLNSPTHQMEILIKEFNDTSGYYTTFIPALKALSDSYTTYYNQLETANNTLLSQLDKLETN